MALVKYNNNSISSITAAAGMASGGLNLITTNTISSGVSSSSFTSSIDSTYDTYLFKFINIHGATENILFTFNLSADGGSNYNVTKTSTFFTARHREDDSNASTAYQTAADLAQSTSYQQIFFDSGIANDDASSGELYLFSPSNTTFVKHFIGRFGSTNTSPQNYDNYFAGYGNTTSAVNAIDFKFSSGNIDSGTIKMYGLSKS